MQGKNEERQTFFAHSVANYTSSKCVKKMWLIDILQILITLSEGSFALNEMKLEIW